MHRFLSFSGHAARPALSLAIALLLLACAGERADATADPAPVTTPASSAPVAAEPVSAAQQDADADADVDAADADADDAEEDDGAASLAQFGGAAAASAELCGKPYGAAQLVEMKEKQKEMYVALGGDASRYEADFRAGFARGKAEFEAAGEGKRSQFCGNSDAWR